tara:strand:- start:1974 stop:2459 length:486 start_codon:yes stop_codon:yes gene_type:complete
MKILKTFIALVFCIFLFGVNTQKAYACVEGLSWGMDLSSIEYHLGVPLKPIELNKSKDIYEVRDFKMSGLPVISLRLLVKDGYGLKQLAYEMEYANMTEVLAGLRHRFGAPIGTSIDIDSGSSQQQWIWHTGEDVITAIKSDKSPFLLSYKPSLLDPSFLG